MLASKADVMRLARIVEEQEEVVRSMGMMNTPTDIERRVEAQAALRVATDLLYKYRQDYMRAFDSWVYKREWKDPVIQEIVVGTEMNIDLEANVPNG